MIWGNFKNYGGVGMLNLKKQPPNYRDVER